MNKLALILEELRKTGVSATMVNKLETLAKQFAGPEQFFSATRGELSKVWNQLTPDSPKGLGDGFFEAFDRAAGLWRTPEADAAVLQSAPLSRMITTGHLQKLKDFMEMFSLQELPLGKLLDILDTVEPGGRHA